MLRYPTNQNWILNAEFIKVLTGMQVGTETEWGYVEIRN
jgi:hypothetical protein